MARNREAENGTAMVSHWLQQLQAGEEEAIRELWSVCYAKAKAVASRKLPRTRREADEEDVAASALYSLFRGAKDGRFPRLTRSDDLWRLLATMTARKVSRHREKQQAIKRGGGHVRGESAFSGNDGSMGGAGIGNHAGQELAPDVIVQMKESVDQLLEKLGDDVLQQIVLSKMSGETNAEIADRLGISARSVERKLAIIRIAWCQALAADSE